MITYFSVRSTGDLSDDLPPFVSGEMSRRVVLAFARRRIADWPRYKSFTLSCVSASIQHGCCEAQIEFVIDILQILPETCNSLILKAFQTCIAVMSSCFHQAALNDFAIRDRVEAKMPNVEKFPRPWWVEETDAAYIVKDATGIVVGRVEVGVAMTREEAQAIAQGMVKSADALASASKIQRKTKMQPD